MYKYETHTHTSPVSKCARITPRESLTLYKRLGYDGVFVTNHFLCGNIGGDRTRPYEEQVEYYFNGYKETKALSKEIGIDVFLGVELSYKGTDFLIYGLDEDWYRSHPEIMDMTKREELAFIMAQEGSLVIQAHPFRRGGHIDHVRLYPDVIHGMEILNGSRKPEENELARIYAETYGFCVTAGSDYHNKPNREVVMTGILTEEKLRDEAHFVSLVKAGQIKIAK